MKRIAGAILIFVFISGCQHNGTHTVEDLIEAYDYQAALTLLESEQQQDPVSVKSKRLRGMTLLVEGRTDEGLNLLSEGVGGDDGLKEENSRAILKAAEVVIREVDRAEEAVYLLDTCLNIDPGLLEECSKLAWNRSVEYLNEATDAGYYTADFLKRRNSKMMSRLRSGHTDLTKKFNEIAVVKAHLELLKKTYLRYLQSQNHNAISISTLELPPSGMKPGWLRKGWCYAISDDSDRGRMIVAEVLPNNPAALPIGMKLTLSMIED